MQTLLGPQVLSTLPPDQARTLTGRASSRT
jgi:hypothetical protein